MANVVLVHGICHGAWCWQGTVDALSAQGHHVVALDLPLTSLSADADAVRAALDQIAGPKVLAGHSYGGLVISRAASGRGDISHLVYVAAAMIPGDAVFIESTANFPTSPLAEQAEFTADGQIVVSPAAAIDCFYGRCAPEAARDAASRLRPTALACVAEPTGAQPWETTPSTYMLCTEDRAIHPDMQRWMSEQAGVVITYETDHSPFLSAASLFVADVDHIASTG